MNPFAWPREHGTRDLVPVRHEGGAPWPPSPCAEPESPSDLARFWTRRCAGGTVESCRARSGATPPATGPVGPGALPPPGSTAGPLSLARPPSVATIGSPVIGPRGVRGENGPPGPRVAAPAPQAGQSGGLVDGAERLDRVRGLLFRGRDVTDSTGRLVSRPPRRWRPCWRHPAGRPCDHQAHTPPGKIDIDHTRPMITQRGRSPTLWPRRPRSARSPNCGEPAPPRRADCGAPGSEVAGWIAHAIEEYERGQGGRGPIARS